MKPIFFLCMSRIFGGAERIGFQAAKEMELNFNAKIFVNKSIETNFSQLGNKISSVFVPKTFSKISNNPFSILYFVIVSFLLYSIHRPKTGTIFYCNDLESVFSAVLPKILCGGKIIWHVHDVYKVNKMRTRMVIGFALFFVDLMICITSENSNRMKSLFSRKIVVIPNYSRLNPIAPGGRSKSLDSTELVLGYIGQITRWKRVDLTIQFVEKLNFELGVKSKLIIAGAPLFKSDYVYHQQLTKQTKRSDHVEWLGSIDDVVKFYSEIDFLLLFSTNEPFGLVLVEALSQGVPVIASFGDGPNEVVHKSTGFIVDPEDEQSIVDVANSLKKITEEKYNKMSSDCILEAYHLYSSESFNHRVMEVVYNFMST